MMIKANSNQCCRTRLYFLDDCLSLHVSVSIIMINKDTCIVSDDQQT